MKSVCLISTGLCAAISSACGGGSEPQVQETCPQAWTWTDGACEPLLPASTGTGLAGSVEPLRSGDLTLADQQALAERFQPALVFSGAQMWPVPAAYCAASGADLLVYSADDTEHSAGTVAVSNADLGTTDLSGLPADGLVYGLDCPGDNLGPGYDEASWFTEWDALQGDDPATATFAPRQYTHLAWFDRSADLILIQYWFYYPFDKFANAHEGDWEHIQVVVDMSTDPASLADVHWFFHSLSFASFQRLTRITDDAGGDHVVVFAGGCGEFDGWGGCYSGASYPWPGQYQEAAPFVVEDTTAHARYLHPDEIAVELLPEPEDVASAPLDVSWLTLEVYFGQWEVAANSSAIQVLGGYEAPPQPVHKGSWDKGLNDAPWTGEDDSTYAWFEPPEGWEVLYNPGHDDGVRPE